MRPFALLLSVLALLVAAPARAADGDKKDDRVRRQTLTVETSLGPIEADGTRDLLAEGKAPKGSKIIVRFFRGHKAIARRHMKARKRRYKAAKPIDRTGSYKVVVVAKTRTGQEIKVSARLKYGPKAEAPSAPDSDGNGGGGS